MKTLIIGDNTIEFAKQASKEFPNSRLLSNDNFNDHIITTGIFYTSLADLTTENLTKAITIAKTVIYYPEYCSNLELKKQTEYFLYTCQRFVNGFTDKIESDPENLLRLVDTRRSNQKQLWISGCSFADGMGVTPKQRFGQLVADKLNIPVSFLTCPGTSIPWAADQILRSDIRSGDIVIWGLTSINRYLSYKNKIELNVQIGIFKDSKNSKDFFAELLEMLNRTGVEESHQKIILESFNRTKQSIEKLSKQEQKELEKGCLDDDRVFQAVKSIFQVINFCNQTGAKLIMFLFPLSTRESEEFVIKYIGSADYFLKISPFRDNSSWSDLHPGILSHQTLAEEIVNFINKRKHI